MYSTIVTNNAKVLGMEGDFRTNPMNMKKSHHRQNKKLKPPFTFLLSTKFDLILKRRILHHLIQQWLQQRKKKTVEM